MTAKNVLTGAWDMVPRMKWSGNPFVLAFQLMYWLAHALFVSVFALAICLCIFSLQAVKGVIRWAVSLITRNKKAPVTDMDGFDFEQYVAKKLKQKGFRDITVTPRSGDFGADIIATDKHGDRVCFQCKRYSKPVGIRAVQEISSARTYYGCKKAAVVTNSSYTKAAADLASAENVALFDIAYFE